MIHKKKIPHDIQIKPSDNGGFIVKIGCSTRVYEKTDAMLVDLEEFLSDPEKANDEYLKMTATAAQGWGIGITNAGLGRIESFHLHQDQEAARLSSEAGVHPRPESERVDPDGYEQ